jgi:hypothetical protein
MSACPPHSSATHAAGFIRRSIGVLKWTARSNIRQVGADNPSGTSIYISVDRIIHPFYEFSSRRNALGIMSENVLPCQM